MLRSCDGRHGMPCPYGFAAKWKLGQAGAQQAAPLRTEESVWQLEIHGHCGWSHPDFAAVAARL